MRSVLLSVSRAALFCLLMAILRAHALVVIPPEALPETLRTLETDVAFTEPASGMVRHPAAASDSLPVPPSIPTVTRVLPSHDAPWHAQADAPGHAPGTQRPLNGRIRIHDAELAENALHDLDGNSAPWAAKPMPNRRESESSPRTRRRRPDGVDDDATVRERTSDDSKLSVLALAVVGVVLACHYLDYL